MEELRKDELYKLLAKEEKRVERARQKRCIITILSFAVVFFVVMCKIARPSGVEMVGAFLASVFLAGIYFFVNSLIFIALVKKGESETQWLEHIRKQISEHKE